MLFTLLTAAVFSQCTNVTTRYEVNDMTENHVKIFRETIRKAMTTPDPQNPSMTIWEAGANLHSAIADDIHNSPAFFFWHRLFLSTIEKKLQRINPEFYFPYWDSTREWKSFRNSQALKISDMSDTPLALERIILNTTLPAAESFANHFQTSINSKEGFEYYHSALEVLHGNVHVAIGGQMATMKSPLDPLFYMHHGHLDYEWSKCQAGWGSRYPQVGGILSNGKKATLNTAIPSYKNEFGDVLVLSNLCIAYAPVGTRPPPVTESSTSRMSTTTPKATTTTPKATSTTTTATSVSATKVSTTPAVTITEVAPVKTTERSTVSVTTKISSVPVTSKTITITTSAPSLAITTPIKLVTPTAISTSSKTSSIEMATSVAPNEATATSIESPLVTETVPNLPTPPKQDSCPAPLPESWIAMNKLNKTSCVVADVTCEKVVKEVAEGVVFTPPPILRPEEYKQVMGAVLPQDYVVKPPSAPEFPFYSGGERAQIYLGLLAVGAALF